MKLSGNMRLTVLCLAASAVSASYEGFFGKPTSNIESNEKTRRIEQQLSKNLGGSAKPISAPGPRGGSKPKENTDRALKYYYPYDYPPQYEYPGYHDYEDEYYYEDPYYGGYPQKEMPYRQYPKYHYYPSSSKSKKMKSMMWGGKMSMKWQGKWRKKWGKHKPAYRKFTVIVSQTEIPSRLPIIVF